MKVFWTPLARQRLAEIEAYIAQDNPQAARRMAARLVQRSRTLENPPLLGKRLAQYPDADIRELLSRPFRLIFRVMPEHIEILTMMHYRQLLPSDLAELQ
jgi:plasmid stabilization system protein ParE